MKAEFTKEVTKVLAEFATKLRYEDIPADVSEKAKIYILDSLGCSIGGFLTEPGEKRWWISTHRWEGLRSPGS